MKKIDIALKIIKAHAAYYLEFLKINKKYRAIEPLELFTIDLDHVFKLLAGESFYFYHESCYDLYSENRSAQECKNFLMELEQEYDGVISFQGDADPLLTLEIIGELIEINSTLTNQIYELHADGINFIKIFEKRDFIVLVDELLKENPDRISK